MQSERLSNNLTLVNLSPTWRKNVVSETGRLPFGKLKGYPKCSGYPKHEILIFHYVSLKKWFVCVCVSDLSVCRSNNLKSTYCNSFQNPKNMEP